MNPHIGAAMWIIAMMVGFVIWWPIGAMILGAITFTALTQQLTGGYRLPPPAAPPQQPQRPAYEPLMPIYFDKWGNKLIGQDRPKQVTQVEVKQITDQSKR